MIKLHVTINSPGVGILAKIMQYDLQDPELVLKFWHEGEYLKGAEYYTEDLEDAISTAHYQINQLKGQV